MALVCATRMPDPSLPARLAVSVAVSVTFSVSVSVYPPVCPSVGFPLSLARARSRSPSHLLTFSLNTGKGLANVIELPLLHALSKHSLRHAPPLRKAEQKGVRTDGPR